MAVHGGYTEHIVGRVSSLVAVCTRRVSRATRRLLRHRHRYGVGSGASTASYRRRTRPVGSDSFFTRPREQQQDAGMETTDEAEGDGEGVVWRRAILMGERCQPLDFAGAIHYDSFGRRLARPPTGPRSASSLSCRTSSSLAAYLETTEV
ncbi:uncharacterized protein LOC124648154 [Lolium rigidum]|uniref:uncharacterized protein LOC124648154 n=1 Tax=Lolium rigidum TaxID=89674 RepID=UPI001F5C5A94|nr:uncharacterized protein LOC124648154 [Lolium rigidum]